MKERAEDSGLKHAFCLLVIFGAENPSPDSLPLLEPTAANNLSTPCIVAKVLYVPTNDKFGISKDFLDIVSVMEMSEILASHSFIANHENSDRNFVKSCLRKSRPKPDHDPGLALMNKLAGVVDAADVGHEGGQKEKRKHKGISTGQAQESIQKQIRVSVPGAKKPVLSVKCPLFCFWTSQ